MSNFLDDDGFGPARIPDRPERPKPKPLDHATPGKWVPAPSADPNRTKTPTRVKIDTIVRRLLPVAGLLILVGIAIWIGTFIAGVY